MFSFSPRTKAIVIALGIFILGTVCGVIGSRWMGIYNLRPFWADNMRKGGPPRHERILDMMTRRLDLTEEQRETIGVILRDSRNEIDEVRKKVHEDMMLKERAVREKIRAVLTVEQLEKYDKTMRQIDRRRSAEDRRGPPPPDSLR
jgi:Spy/CpxP family protein refolding chaperone